MLGRGFQGTGGSKLSSLVNWTPVVPVIQIILSWHPVSTEFLLPSQVALLAASRGSHSSFLGANLNCLNLLV